MRKITIDCLKISDKEELHDTLAKALNFPDWYGKNLDALYDCLTSIFEEITITIENFSVLEKNLGSYAAAFMKVMKKADEDNERITVVFLKKKDSLQ